MKTCKLHPYQVAGETTQSGIPWNIQQCNAPAFWPYAKGISPVGAIIDTGIDTAHPEFKGRIFMPKSFDGPMGDTEGHGTHVAGTAMGATQGMFPWARVMPLKVGFGTGQTNIQIWDAFLAIMDHNLTCKDEDKVVAVNCSFDGPADPTMNYYIRELTASGVTIVVAAGNRGDGDPSTEECFSYPGFLWEVITTGALNQDSTGARFSSSYDGIDIAAPGSAIPSAWPGGGYMLLSGTSMASPHVFGAVLLIKAAFRNKYGRWPTTEETEGIIWKCVKPLNIHEKLVGRGGLYMPNRLTNIEAKRMDVAPSIKWSRTYVPLRFMAEGLGAQVDWDAATKTVTAELGDNKVEMTIDVKGYFVESKVI